MFAQVCRAKSHSELRSMPLLQRLLTQLDLPKQHLACQLSISCQHILPKVHATLTLRMRQWHKAWPGEATWACTEAMLDVLAEHIPSEVAEGDLAHVGVGCLPFAAESPFALASQGCNSQVPIGIIIIPPAGRWQPDQASCGMSRRYCCSAWIAEAYC